MYIKLRKNELLTKVNEFMHMKFEWHRSIEKIKSDAKMKNVSLKNFRREGIEEVIMMWDEKLQRDDSKRRQV